MESDIDFFEEVGVRVVPLVEELVRAAIDEGVHQDRARRLAVPARSANLLVIGLHAAGQAGVDDRPDVSLINAHSEGDRRDDDIEPASEEGGLDPIALRSLEARMVG